VKAKSKHVACTALLLIASSISTGQPASRISRTAQAQEQSSFAESVYRENCAACHGQNGDGNGAQANRLRTKPRDFSKGIYKFRSTPSGSLPLDNDIYRTITQGVSGTSMLAQLQLSEQERWAVVQYLKTFSTRFLEEKPRQAAVVPPRVHETAQVVALGKALYEQAGCVECHGPSGRGNGPSAKNLKDDWGDPIVPTDLTEKPFKSGPHEEDLYRTISTGLNGTPMPSYADSLTPNQRWSLVLYISSIATEQKPRGMMGLVGEEIEGMRIDMSAAMAGMMGGKGMGRGGKMGNRNMMKDMMGR